MRLAWVMAVLGCLLPGTWATAAAAWDFPEIARVVPHFAERMSCADPAVRLRVITELTYFHPRNSAVYVPFFRRVLRDPSPEVCWEALARLDDHGMAVDASSLPAALQVPLVGPLSRGDPASVARLREIAAGREAPAGWAIRALGLIGDAESVPLATQLLTSDNVFVRYAAASALVQLGQVAAGKAALRVLTTTPPAQDGGGYYRMAAAERLCRLGERAYLGALIAAIPPRLDYADSASALLEDLTGQYFATYEEWKAWWDGTGKGV